MKPIKKVLIATDFSEFAKNALKRAIEISLKHQSSLTIMHVIYSDWIESMHNLFSKQSSHNTNFYKNMLKKIFLSEMKSDNASIKTNFIVKTGREYVELTKAAKNKKIDMAVLGAHGRNFLDKLIFGSTAKNVIKNADYPILLVKNKPRFSYKKILVPIDFSPVGQEAIEFACRLFPDAELELLYVADLWYAQKTRDFSIRYNREAILRKKMRTNFLSKMKKVANRCNVDKSKIKFALKGGYPAPVIEEYAKKHNADLIVIGTRGQSKLQYILLGNVTEKILQITSKDVLVVPPK
mgnify:CR=1 FL=1|jgi:Universal stress protein UspA and related nucleotide-binding proteins